MSVCIISLQENSLGMDGAIFIATALKGNHQLTYIKWVFFFTLLPCFLLQLYSLHYVTVCVRACLAFQGRLHAVILMSVSVFLQFAGKWHWRIWGKSHIWCYKSQRSRLCGGHLTKERTVSAEEAHACSTEITESSVIRCTCKLCNLF